MFRNKNKNKNKNENENENENINYNNLNDISTRFRNTNIYFKGTIWNGMREKMYDAFVNKPKCAIKKNNDYWKWRCESLIKPTQSDLEDTAYESYYALTNSKLCLCPKGNGNSSMRIVEALACGSIPILINDFSAPLDRPWDSTDDAIALVVTASAPISFEVMPDVATFSLPAVSARVPPDKASLVNSVWSMMLFINVLVITSFVAKVCVVSTTPAILFL